MFPLLQVRSRSTAVVSRGCVVVRAPTKDTNTTMESESRPVN